MLLYARGYTGSKTVAEELHTDLGKLAAHAFYGQVCGKLLEN